jgi:hypothetical protein
MQLECEGNGSLPLLSLTLRAGLFFRSCGLKVFLERDVLVGRRACTLQALEYEPCCLCAVHWNVWPQVVDVCCMVNVGMSQKDGVKCSVFASSKTHVLGIVAAIKPIKFWQEPKLKEVAVPLKSRGFMYSEKYLFSLPIWLPKSRKMRVPLPSTRNLLPPISWTPP